LLALLEGMAPEQAEVFLWQEII